MDLEKKYCSECTTLLWITNGNDSIKFDKENSTIEGIEFSTYNDENVDTKIKILCKKCNNAEILEISVGSVYGAVDYCFN